MTPNTESTPLVASSSSPETPATRGQRQVNSCRRLAIVGISVLVLTAISVTWVRHHLTTVTTTQTIEVIEPSGDIDTKGDAEGTKATLYRPFCEYYDAAKGKSSPYLIQTSFQQPSRQWDVTPCFPASNTQPSDPLSLLRPPPSTLVQLNAYGAPDALLRVNFSQPAFDNRPSILGFGGAFTEAAALNFNRLSAKGKEAVMELLFGKSGLGYRFGRIPINSCDFSVKSYSFDETVDDFELKDFDTTVQHDAEVGMIDMARRAVSVFRKAWGAANDTSSNGNMTVTDDGHLLLYASPWSPPSWMKKPTWEDPEGALYAAKMTYSGFPNCLRDGVGPKSKYAKAWALYFSKFLTAYQNLGLPLWAITVQNEPEFAAPWEACAYTPETQRDFVANHLGPQLAKDHPDVKLLIFDHNKDHVNVWAEALLNASSPAANYVDGTSYHWYAGGMDRLLDGAIGSANLHRLQSKLQRLGIEKNHLVLGSEACHCPTTGYAGGDPDIAWSRAERYAHTILADLAAGSNGWVEWNLILDGIGGPNHLGNLCETTILAVPHRAVDAGDDIAPLPDFEKDKPMGNVSIGDGRTREELNALGFPAKFLDLGVAVQPMYYYMGQISRYVRPGSKAVLGLVHSAADGGRIFRPEGQSVAGGGFNELARTGIELTLWPCEGSTRQQFAWNETTKKIEVFGHDWLGNPTKSCVSKEVDVDLKGLRLTKCGRNAGVFDFIPFPNAPANNFNVVLRNGQSRRESCLVVEELKNHGGAYGPRGGAQVSLGDCKRESAKWLIDRNTGEAISYFLSDDEDNTPVCMTTGWPFLQMGAFLTPAGEAAKTVVILNEGRDAANYALEDENKVVLTGMIPPRSIQTVLIE